MHGFLHYAIYPKCLNMLFGVWYYSHNPHSCTCYFFIIKWSLALSLPLFITKTPEFYFHPYTCSNAWPYPPHQVVFIDANTCLDAWPLCSCDICDTGGIGLVEMAEEENLILLIRCARDLLTYYHPSNNGDLLRNNESLESINRLRNLSLINCS